MIFSLSVPFYGLAAFNGAPQVSVQDFLSQLEGELLNLQKKDFAVRWSGLQEAFQRDLFYGAPGGDDVKRLQGLLIILGYLNPKYQTGYFYGLTRKAVQNYQKARGIVATGYVGRLTRSVLEKDFKNVTQEAESQEFSGSVLPNVVTVIGDSVYSVLPRPDYQKRKLQELISQGINKERVKAGLGELQWMFDVEKVAQIHSDNQAAENMVITDSDKPCSYPFIHHETFPTGKNVGDRLEKGGVDFLKTGENIAIVPVVKKLGYQLALGEKEVQCPDVKDAKVPESLTEAERVEFLKVRLNERVDAIGTVPYVKWTMKEWYTPEEFAEVAVQGWMNSPGHKANILTKDFDETGIGVAFVNDYVVLTQNFVRR